jgi:hypothetical protein
MRARAADDDDKVHSQIAAQACTPARRDVVLACGVRMYIFAGVLVLSRLVAPAPRRNVDAVTHAALRIHNLQHCIARPHGLGFWLPLPRGALSRTVAGRLRRAARARTAAALGARVRAATGAKCGWPTCTAHAPWRCATASSGVLPCLSTQHLALEAFQPVIFPLYRCTSRHRGVDTLARDGVGG